MLKKSIAVLTAVAAIASASSVFAADYADQVVKLTDSEKAETLTDTTAQYTVVIVDKKTGNEAVTLSADDLYYINQGTSADTFWTNMGTKTALTDGDYTIRIGSNVENFTVKEYYFTVATVDNKTTYTVKYGDVNDDDSVNGVDATLVLKYSVAATENKKFTSSRGKGEMPAAVGDINDDGSTNGVDATLILKYSVAATENKKFISSKTSEELTTYKYTVENTSTEN